MPQLPEKISAISLNPSQAKWGLLFIILITAFIHHSAIDNELYWDDVVQVKEGKLINSWSNIPTIFVSEVWRNAEAATDSRKTQLDSYRPVFNLSLFLDRQLWGNSSRGAHLTNLVIHLLNIIFVFLLMAQFRDRWTALAVASIFAVHPATITCVHYISSRPDSLTTMFSLLAAYFALSHSNSKTRKYILSGCCFILACLSKETSLTFPVWICAAVYLFEHRKTKRQLLFPGIVFSLSYLIYFVLRFTALRAMKAVETPSHILEIVFNYPDVLVYTLRAAVLETTALPLIQFPTLLEPFAVGQLLGAALFFSAGGLLIIYALKKNWYWTQALLWIVTFMLPPTVAIVKTDTINGYYYYGAIVGTSMLLEHILSALGTTIWKNRLSVIPIVFFLIICSSLSYIYAPIFRTEISFYRAIIATGKPALDSIYNLGNAYLRKNNYQQAVYWYQQGIEFAPLDPRSHNNLAIAYFRSSQIALAQKHAEFAIKHAPPTAKYHHNLALILFERNDWKKGIVQLEKSLQVDNSYRSSVSLARQFCTSTDSILYKNNCKRIYKLLKTPK